MELKHIFLGFLVVSLVFNFWMLLTWPKCEVCPEEKVCEICPEEKICPPEKVCEACPDLVCPEVNCPSCNCNCGSTSTPTTTGERFLSGRQTPEQQEKLNAGVCHTEKDWFGARMTWYWVC